MEEATLLGNNLKVSAINAGFSNGMAAHANETDDSHTKGRFHPGCAIIPTTLAIAEKEDLSSDQIFKAIALGYDSGVRFTTRLDIKHPKQVYLLLIVLDQSLEVQHQLVLC